MTATSQPVSRSSGVWVRHRWWQGRLTPWATAGRLYGQYGLPKADLGALDAVAAPAGRVLARLESALPALLTVRTWLTLNVIAVVAQLTSEGFGPFVATMYQGGAVTMVVGPVGLLVAVAALVLVAQRGRRGTAIRQLTRPVVLAGITLLVSVGIFGLQVRGVRQALRGLIEPVRQAVTDPPLSVLAGLIGVWLLVFGVCALYLIHHHSFCGQGNSLLDPLVSVWLAWTVGAVEIVMLADDQVGRGSFVTVTVVSATTATLISAGELIALHRKGTTFRRGPWAAAAS